MRGGRQGQPLPNTRWLLPVWLFSGVCPQMSCEIRRSGEDLATVPEAEGREVGEALGWSTLPFSRFLFIQSPAQRLYTWWQDCHARILLQYLLFALSPDISQSTGQRDQHHSLGLGALVTGISEGVWRMSSQHREQRQKLQCRAHHPS